MKKVAILCGAMISVFASATQFNHDFHRRFGPDSAIYNEPLYFSNREPKKRDNRPRKSFREQIRTRMHKDDAKRSK